LKLRSKKRAVVAVVGGGSGDPEFLDAAGVEKRFGIRRSRE
jgi:hypothetical protein